jgi:hypothetical protein
MSKFNILVNKGIIGEEWLDALNFEYYLFLSEEFVPSPEQRTYIEECYNNTITDKVKFEHCQLQSKRAIEKEGYALHRKGPKYGFGDSFFAISELKEIMAEPLQRTREFETILMIENDSGFDYNSMPARSGKTWGRIKIDIEYTIYKRAKSIHKKFYGKRIWDYYEIPEKNDDGTKIDIINYIPLEKDYRFYREEPEAYMAIQPGPYPHGTVRYTPEIGELLERIIEGSCKIGKMLNYLFDNIDKLDNKLGFNRLLQLADKTKGEKDGNKK